MHPFLSADFPIAWSALTPERVVADITEALARAQERVDALAAKADDPEDSPGFADTLLAYEDATEELSMAWSKVSLLDAVDNSPALREAYNAMLPKVSEFDARLPLNEKLWTVIRRFSESEAAKALDPVGQRFLEETVASFRRRGADLPPAQKEALQKLETELAAKTQKFSENVLDSTNDWELVLDDDSRLQGLPESALEAARQSAESKGHGTAERPAYRFTLHAPSFLPVMKYAEDAELRREIWEAFLAIGAHEPWNNTELMWEILELRHRKAQLLDFDNFGDLVLERRMARTGAQALAFVEDLHRRTKPYFDRECAHLLDFKRQESGLDEPLKPWETAFWAERLRRREYDFDEEALRPFFPIDSVLQGMFELTSRIFGFRIEERPSVHIDPNTGARTPAGAPAGAVEVWHPEVRCYDFLDADGKRLGAFYADWHPRESKRSGAWMGDLRTGDRSPEKFTLHLGYITGNLTPATGSRPALLTHDEVLTIFHEFGHLIHHLCGNVPIKSLNGVHVPWDFVELPSQILENWCWERESLDLFARHWQTGEPIPEPLFQKMRETRNFHAAMAMMRQLSFGKMDLELHLNYADPARRPAALTDTPDEFLRSMLEPYLVPVSPSAPLNFRQFGHLFANPTGYAAGYYSYKWAEVLEADAFSRFLSEGILNPDTGKDFRESILSRGNSADPNHLFHAFMGRDPDPEALLVRSGLAEAIA